MSSPMMPQRTTINRRYQAMAEEKERLALEIKILEADIERKRLQDAIDELAQEEEDAPRCFSRRLPLASFLQRSDISQGNLDKQQYGQKHHDDTTQTTATTVTFIMSDSWDSRSEQAIEASDSVHDYETIEEEESLGEKSFEEQTVDDDSCDEGTLDDKSYEEYTVEESIVEDNQSLGSFFEELTLASEDYDLDYDIDEMDSCLRDESLILCSLPQAPLYSFAEEDETDEEDDILEEYLPESCDPELVATEQQHMEGSRRDNVFEQAAALGRLTRLKEHTIESVSIERKEVETAWKSVGLLALDNYQSIYRQVLEEAAAKGARTKLPENIFTTDDDQVEAAVDHQVYGNEEEARPNVKQLSALFGSARFHSSIVVAEGTMSLDAFLGKQKSHRNVSARPKARLPTAVLPLPTLPTNIRGDSGETPQSIAAVAKEASVAAWDRHYRSRKRGLRIRHGCACLYCATSCPRQTLAYQQQQQRQASSVMAL